MRRLVLLIPLICASLLMSSCSRIPWQQIGLGGGEDPTRTEAAHPRAPAPKPPRKPRPAPKSKPNIVFILADDQRPDALPLMPGISGRRDWVRFDTALANTALCCPARATLLSGLNSDHSGVGSNSEAANFDGQPTIADQLQRAGYTTGFIGKYFNGFPWQHAQTFVPRGWDRWLAFAGDQGYHDYDINDDGITSRPPMYSTDLFAAEAAEFVATAPGPFLAFLSFFGPHGPATAPPRYENLKVDLPRLDRSFNERDVSDKPRWIQELPPVDRRRELRQRAKQIRAGRAIDDAVQKIFATLRQRGELDNTIVVYSSDHAIAAGEHRYAHKSCAYEVCSRIPLLVRIPGVDGRRERALVSNVDLAPTLLDYAGAGEMPTDGRSLRPLLEGRIKRVHPAVLLRRPSSGSPEKIYSGVRTERFKLIHYPASGERELYDLKRDPLELRNLLAAEHPTPRVRSRAAQLTRTMRRLMAAEPMRPSARRAAAKRRRQAEARRERRAERRRKAQQRPDPAGERTPRRGAPGSDGRGEGGSTDRKRRATRASARSADQA